MQIKKPNRIRKNVATTVDPDIHWVIGALSAKDQKGKFLDEVISEWLTSCAWFEMPGSVVVRLFNANLFYIWQDRNGDECSPQFKTFREAITWLKTTYPESNKYINI